MKLKNRYGEFAVFITVIIVIIVLISSTNFDTKTDKPLEKIKSEPDIDNPSMLPDWQDGEYHDYEATKQKIIDLDEKYPDLFNYFSIGKSVLEKDILCISITNESNNNRKFTCLIDGSIHGNEWEAGEACLYLAEYLLINYGENSTITNILDTAEIYIVPLLNPDGRDKNTRWNENGIDLNRNFDVHFGRLKGKNYPLGKLFGIFKIPYITLPRKGTYTNCGRKPFSEPESQAIKELGESLINKDFSFYLNCHTAMHGFASVVDISHKPEYEVSEHEIEVLHTALDWVDENTEYEVQYVDSFSYYGAGLIHHWFFKEYHIPSFCFEILSMDYEPWLGSGRHDNLVHWMKTTIPVYMYLLMNIENLYNWENPSIQPQLPEGVPPVPI